MLARSRTLVLFGLTLLIVATATAHAQEIKGKVKGIDEKKGTILVNPFGLHREIKVQILPDASFEGSKEGEKISLTNLKTGDSNSISNAAFGAKIPLAALRGLAYSYNMTIGIPVDIQIAKVVRNAF